MYFIAAFTDTSSLVKSRRAPAAPAPLLFQSIVPPKSETEPNPRMKSQFKSICAAAARHMQRRAGAAELQASPEPALWPQTPEDFYQASNSTFRKKTKEMELVISNTRESTADVFKYILCIFLASQRELPKGINRLCIISFNNKGTGDSKCMDERWAVLWAAAVRWHSSGQRWNSHRLLLEII